MQHILHNRCSEIHWRTKPLVVPVLFCTLAPAIPICAFPAGRKQKLTLTQEPSFKWCWIICESFISGFSLANEKWKISCVIPALVFIWAAFPPPLQHPPAEHSHSLSTSEPSFTKGYCGVKAFHSENFPPDTSLNTDCSSHPRSYISHRPFHPRCCQLF